MSDKVREITVESLDSAISGALLDAGQGYTFKRRKIGPRIVYTISYMGSEALRVEIWPAVGWDGPGPKYTLLADPDDPDSEGLRQAAAQINRRVCENINRVHGTGPHWGKVWEQTHMAHKTLYTYNLDKHADDAYRLIVDADNDRERRGVLRNLRLVPSAEPGEIHVLFVADANADPTDPASDSTRVAVIRITPNTPNECTVTLDAEPSGAYRQLLARLWHEVVVTPIPAQDADNDPFIIPTTKPEFERKLETFVNDYKKSTLSQNKDGISVLLSPLISWRALRRRRTEEERRRTQFDSHYQEWEYIRNIAEADAIELTCDPFRGLVLELTEKEAGLWVVVHPEGDMQSKTVWEDGVYRHKEPETIPIDPQAHIALSDWLKSLGKPEPMPAQDTKSDAIEKFVLKFKGNVRRFRKFINGLNSELTNDDPFLETCYQHRVIDNEDLRLSLLDLENNISCGNVTALSLPGNQTRLEVWHESTDKARKIWQRLYDEMVGQGFVEEPTPTQETKGAGKDKTVTMGALTERQAFERVMLELDKQEGFRVERGTRGDIVTHTVFRDDIAILEYRLQGDKLYREEYAAIKRGERDATQREEDRKLFEYIQSQVERLTLTGAEGTKLKQMLDGILAQREPTPAQANESQDGILGNDRPIVTATTHTLPFDKLSPNDFERLCLWLVTREGYERAEHLGAAGSEQGRDITAWCEDKLWAFQCKRVQRFGPKSALVEVEKVLALPQAERPVGLVFVVTCNVSAKTRRQMLKRCGEEMECHFWTGTELDEKVKRHSDLLQEFFHIASDGA